MFVNFFRHGMLGLCVAISVALVPLAFIPGAAKGYASTPEALSWLVTALLLPIGPALYAYPDDASAVRVMTAGIFGGFMLMLEYYRQSFGSYTYALQAIGATIGWTSAFFYALAGIAAALVGACIGWNINYLIIAYAKRVNKDWP